MLTSLRIQNFRSIRDASVKLGQVNLFIGPNNSGKSNFLKGVELLSLVTKSLPSRPNIKPNLFATLLPRDNTKDSFQTGMRFEISFLAKTLQSISIDYSETSLKVSSESHLIASDFPDTEVNLTENIIINNLITKLQNSISTTHIYKPDPTKFIEGIALSNKIRIATDASNLVPFIFNLSQNYKSIFRKLEKDLEYCVRDLVSISTPVSPNQADKLKLKFFDQNDIGYWADEVSEGVLYFLALLCIVHQPDPPKLLLLEEPEKGIHPRRIREVMDFIFELARLRGIQIILTSHSPYVVDHFADIPECISVFDRENGETVIRNAGDIITETNAKLEAEGHERIHYTDALGEYWVSGFLGGVPEVTGGVS